MKPSPFFDRDQQRVERLLVLRAGEEEARVGRDAERQLAQAEVVVGSSSSACAPPAAAATVAGGPARLRAGPRSQPRVVDWITVGLSRITSSRLRSTLRSVLPNRSPAIRLSAAPGNAAAVVALRRLISPPIATMLPSCTRTMVSLSLTVLDASGSVKLPSAPRLTTRLLSVTSLTDGWMCRMMLPSSSICGVTSSAMPEKNGCTVIVGDVLRARCRVVVRGRRDVGDEELVGADLEHRLLVVERRDARAGQHVHVALRLEEGEQRGEVRRSGTPARTPRRRVAGWRRCAVPAAAIGACPRCRCRRAAAEDAGRAVAEQPCRPAAVRKLADRHDPPGPSRKSAQLMPVWIGVGQRDLDDLRFEHHLALDPSRVALRYCSTARSSCGSARTTTTPDCGDHHDRAARRRADDRLQRGRQVGPEIVVCSRRDAARFERAATCRCPVSWSSAAGCLAPSALAFVCIEPDCTRTSLCRGAGPAGSSPGTRASAPAACTKMRVPSILYS